MMGDTMTKHLLMLSALALVAGLGVHAQTPAQGRGAGRGRGESAPPTPAPPPGSAGIYRSDAELTAALKRAIAAANGEQSSSPIANTDQYRVNIVHREKAANALAHPGNTELHYIIEGTGTVVTGGTIVRGAGGTSSATIQDGETRRVQKGDVIVVPAGSAHWYKEVTTPITYLEVRFVAPK
jgi:mannose-6-phosphate isomerase-like protein (cupin superfamily)